MSDIEQFHHKTFEELRHVNEEGGEYWSARELFPVLEYNSWDKFKNVIEKAIIACENSNQLVDNHFSQTGKMAQLGLGTQKEVPDYHLSRYACYLIVQNGDSSKPVIANGQTYFAIQKILDHMGPAELAANLFRATQTEEKLRRDNIKGRNNANRTHWEVGDKVRKTIEELGGTMPENLPAPEKGIPQIEREQAAPAKKLPPKGERRT
ncbi:MAG: BRO family protein [Victivallaceae bacterium]